MKILQVNNQNYEPNFKAKIVAPQELWEAISKSSKSKLRKVNKAITYINNPKTLPGDVITFSKDVRNNRTITASSKLTGIDIASKDLSYPFGSWANLVIKTAKIIRDKFAEFSEIYQKVHS